MFNPVMGALLLMSPTPDALGWALVGVGLAVGFFLRVHPWFQYPCLGACVWCISRDFDIPLDVVLMAVMPICLIKWTRHELWVIPALIVNYFFADDLHPPTSSWTAAVLSALFVGSSDTKLFNVGIVLARHLAPRGVHVMYGLPFFFFQSKELPYFDNVVGTTVACTLFTVMAMEAWFHYALVGLGLACCLLQYIRVPAVDDRN